MIFRKLAVLALLPLLILSCKSNKKDGAEAAEESPQFKTVSEATTYYVDHFSEYKCTTRTAAIDRYINLCSTCEDGSSVSEESIPQNVWNRINTIIPPLPNAEKMQRDLVGHTLAEGKGGNGYFSDDWRWKRLFFR